MKPDHEGPPPVKLFMGVLYSIEERFDAAFQILENKYGRIDIRSGSFPFDISDYYASEMGRPIFRLFITFDTLIHPKYLASIKIETNTIEDQLALNNQRKVNLDPGYMDYDKVVLASAKYNGQKVYLDHGIWADLTLYYQENAFHAYPWSFPDFRSGIYNTFFLKIRARYKGQRRKKERLL